MFWRIFSLLFGWQYVAIPFAFSSEVCRVRSAANGKLYIRCYGSVFVIEGDKAVCLDTGFRRPFLLLTGQVGGQ